MLQSASAHPHKTKLALKGGGAKGFLYVGVAKALAELGVLKNITTIAGSSAGAIGGLLLATGLPIERLEAIMDKADFSNMIYQESYYREASNLYYYKGIHSGAKLVDWFGDIIKEVTGHTDCTLEEWHAIKEKHPEKGMKDLIIEACLLNTKFNQVFSWDKPPYNKVPIKHLVRGSMAVPVFFTPWEYEHTMPDGRKVVLTFVDGGMQSKCPIDVFNLEDNQYNPEALGIWIADGALIAHVEHGTPLPSHEIKSFHDYLSATVEASLNTQTITMLKSPYRQHMVLCETLGVGTLDFNIDAAQKRALAKSGYDEVMAFFKRPKETETLIDQLIALTLSNSVTSEPETESSGQPILHLKRKDAQVPNAQKKEEAALQPPAVNQPF